MKQNVDLVHAALREAIYEEVKGYVGPSNDPVPIGLVYEAVALTFPDLAFSHSQFMEAAICLRESDAVVFDEDEYCLFLAPTLEAENCALSSAVQ